MANPVQNDLENAKKSINLVIKGTEEFNDETVERIAILAYTKGYADALNHAIRLSDNE